MLKNARKVNGMNRVHQRSNVIIKKEENFGDKKKDEKGKGGRRVKD